MKQSMIAQRFQTPEENLLMDIATIAKKTPNLIDLSIGDPDLITDQSDKLISVNESGNK